MTKSKAQGMGHFVFMCGLLARVCLVEGTSAVAAVREQDIIGDVDYLELKTCAATCVMTEPYGYHAPCVGSQLDRHSLTSHAFSLFRSTAFVCFLVRESL